MTDIDFSKPVPFVTYGNGTPEETTVIDSYESATEDMYRMWYGNICTEEELQRIMHVSNAPDYILRTAVDTISANPRLCRVIRAHRYHAGEQWSLEKFLSPINNGYINFKNHLAPEYRDLVQSIGTGSILSNDMNGIIFDSPFGLCSTISYSLIYFIQFSTMALCNFSISIPNSVRGNALRIATRINLRKESLDFDLDPRGIIPNSISQQIAPIFRHICTFIAGHEYGHFLNGDVAHDIAYETNANHTINFNKTNAWKNTLYYSSHEKELKADLAAVNLPIFSEDEYSSYYHHTLLWFAMLAIVEAAEQTIFPPMGTPSHPSAKVRYMNILDKAKRPHDFEENKELYMLDFPETVEELCSDIIEDVSLNFDFYEFYGSAYLAAPNSKWRGRELIDRVDY